MGEEMTLEQKLSARMRLTLQLAEGGHNEAETMAIEVAIRQLDQDLREYRGFMDLSQGDSDDA